MLAAPNNTEVEMETFLVQVFVPADDPSQGGELRGLVRHVATGTESPFLGDDEVLALLHRTPQKRRVVASVPGPHEGSARLGPAQGGQQSAGLPDLGPEQPGTLYPSTRMSNVSGDPTRSATLFRSS